MRRETRKPSRYYLVYDGRAQAYDDTDRAICLEVIGIRRRPPWREVRRDWGDQMACLYSYKADMVNEEYILTDEQFEGVIK